MISKDIRRATLVALGVGAAMAANSAWAQTAGQGSQDAQVDTGEEMGVITVTGSRTITDNALSPTPLTTVDIAELAQDHAQRHRRRTQQAAHHPGRPHPAYAGQRQHQ